MTTYRAAWVLPIDRAPIANGAVTVGDGTLYLLARSDARFDALERAWRDAIEGPAQVASGSH